MNIRETFFSLFVFSLAFSPVFGDTVAYWRFDDADAADGGAVATAVSEENSPTLDAAPSGSPVYSTDVPSAVITDPVTSTSWANGYSLNASGGNNRVEVTDDALLNVDGDFTVEFFMKLTGEPGGWHSFVQRNEENTRRWQVDFDHNVGGSFGRVRSRWDTTDGDENNVSSGNHVFVDTDSGSGDPADYTAEDPFTEGDGANDDTSWHHVAIVYTDAEKKFQIFTDGVAGTEKTLAGTFVHPAANLRIGKLAGEDYGLFIDEVRYSDTALTPDQFLVAGEPVVDLGLDLGGMHAEPTVGGAAGLAGQYWAFDPKAIPTTDNPMHRPGAEGANAGWVDTNVFDAGTAPTGTFTASDDFSYMGNDLTPIGEWLGADAGSYNGADDDMDDGLLRLLGFMFVDTPGTRNFTFTSDDGSVLYIGNRLVISNDNSHGNTEVSGSVNFPAAGFYPVDIRYFNGDWVNPDDETAHGGANFFVSGVTGMVKSLLGKVADSTADFSEAQGQNNWTHGYRNVTADGGARDSYDPAADFIPYPDDWWTGSAWDWPEGNPPWTFAGPEDSHPNGTNNGDEHWAVRRWVAPFADDTPIKVTYKARKSNNNCGNGTTVALFAGGALMDSVVVENNQDEVVRTVEFVVAPGTAVDLALTPQGGDGELADGCDGTLMSMQIEVVPGQADADGDGLPDDWEIANAGNLGSLRPGGDFDGDGIADEDELAGGTHPADRDSDDDGATDGDEIVAGSDPNNPDTDGDGINDGTELAVWGTDPTSADSDGDGFEDCDEIKQGTDPADADDNLFGSLVADSEAEFGGTQGENGWFNGYILYDENATVAGERYVEADAFTANTYDGAGAGEDGRVITGNNAINGRFGFNNKSEGFDDGTFIESVASLGTFKTGDEIQVSFLGAWDEGFVQTPAPNWEVDSVVINGGGELLNVDFSADDGGFTVVDRGTVAGPWTYNAGSGTWSADGGTGVVSSKLVSPKVAAAADGEVTVTIRHRYNFEDDGTADGTRWDGGAVFVNVDTSGTYFTQYPENWWNGNTWDFPDGNVPWTFNGPVASHPNGTNSGELNEEHWSVRRWVADELGAPADLRLIWHVSKSNTNGTGVTGALHVNGAIVDSATIAGNDAEGVTRTVNATINPGDVVDLSLSPVGLGDDRADGADGSNTWLRVSDSPAPSPPPGILVRMVQADAAFANVDAVPAAFEGGADSTTFHSVVNFTDNANGHYLNDEPFPLYGETGDHNNYALIATGEFEITEAGVRTFGVNSDDGFRLFVDGAVVAEFADPRGSADTLGSVDLAAGTHTFELHYYENGGGAQVEMFMATVVGEQAAWDADKFALLRGSQVDTDKDGYNDLFEINTFGDLSQNPATDFDNDRITNGAELAIGLDPANPDSDGDGINDGEELCAYPFTDPGNSDTDGDGVNDFDEMWVYGTSPVDNDSDNDGLLDGWEVANGCLYFQNFDGFAADTTDVGDGSIIRDNGVGSARTVGDALQLTQDGVGSANAEFRAPVVAGLGGGFTVSFDYALSGGGNRPADGFSVNLGAIADDKGLVGEEGHGTGLAVEFDTWDNEGEGAANGIGIDVSIDGGDVATAREAAGADPTNNAFYVFDGSSHHVEISYERASYEDIVKSDGALGYWRFEEADGATTAVDSGSSGTDGTYNGITLGQAGATAELGNAALWNAADLPDNPGSSNVDFGSPGAGALAALTNIDAPAEDANFSADKQASLEFWMKTTQVSGNANNWRSPLIFGVESPADGDNQWGYLTPAGEIGFAVNDAGGLVLSTPSPVNDDAWHHVVQTYDWATGEINIYVDGVVAAMGSAGDNRHQDEDALIQYLGWNPTVDGGAGAASPHLLGQYEGLLDEVAIYDRVLAESEVQEHFAAAAGGGSVTVKVDGVIVHDGVMVGWVPADTDRLAFAARTGGATETLLLDNVCIAGPNAVDPTSHDEISDALLKVHYDFEEGSGTVAGNSGSGGDGTLVNALADSWVPASTSPSPGGAGALQFADGVANSQFYIDTNNGSDALGVNGNGAEYTMMAWMNLGAQGGDKMIFGQPGSDPNNTLHNGVRDGVYHLGHWGNDLQGGSVEVDSWHHVAYRYSAGTQTILVDGVPVASAPRGGLNNPENVIIGATQLDEDGRDFIGMLDDVRIYCAGLSDAKIAELGGLVPGADCLVVHYEFEPLTVYNAGRDEVLDIQLDIANSAGGGIGNGTLNPDAPRSSQIGAFQTTTSPSLGGSGVFVADGSAWIDTNAGADALGVNGDTDYTMMAWIKPFPVGGHNSGDRMVFGQPGGNALHNGLRGSSFHQGHWGNDLNTGGGTVVDEGQWQHAAYIYEGGVQTIVVNGEVASTEAKGALNNPANVLVGTTRTDQSRGFEGMLDDVRIYCDALSLDEIREVAGFGDSDGDGLPDWWERGNFGTLAHDGAADNDNDGLDNAAELANGLSPVVGDTDGDGLTDGQEINDTGTDPTLADTDGDGLSDKGEFDLGTDGTMADSDGDLAGDGLEIAEGTDPLNPASTPPIFVVEMVKVDADFANIDAVPAAFDGGADTTTGHTVINFRDNADGHYGDNEPFPLFGQEGDHNRYALRATGFFAVAEGGPRTFGVNSDDGFRLSVDGEVVAEFADPRGSADTLGTVDLSAGVHELELYFFENGGGAQVEAFVATVTGEQGAWSAENFELIRAVNAPTGGGSVSGLLSYWRLDEGDGDVATDSVGPNNGAINNTATGGIDDGSVWLDDPDRGMVLCLGGQNGGSGGWVHFGDTVIPAMTTENDFTWSFWARSEQANSNDIVFGNRWSPDGTDFAPREFIKFTTRQFEWHYNGGGAENVDFDDMEQDGWHHHLVVKDGDMLVYYRDGVQANAGVITAGPANPQPLYLGGQGGNETWRGCVDEVALFSTALSADEVSTVYNKGANGESLLSPLAANLVAWWPFDDESAADASGNGHDGTLVGTAAFDADGRFGGAVSLSGVDADTPKVEVPDSDDLEFAAGESFSVALWVKSNAATDNDNGYVSKGYDTPDRQTPYWQLQTYEVDGAKTFGFDSRNFDASERIRFGDANGQNPDDGNWHLFVFVRNADTGEVTTYVDLNEPTSEASGTWDMGQNDSPLVIGNHFDRYTQGVFDDVAIWKHALSADDVANIYHNGVAGAIGNTPSVNPLWRTYSVNYSATAPTVDGVVSEGEWDAALGDSGEFYALRVDPATVSGEDVRFKAVWADDALYLLVTSNYGGWNGVGDFNTDNLNIYIDPNGDGEANVGGTVDGYQIVLGQPMGESSDNTFFSEAHVNTPFGNQAEWAPDTVTDSQNNSADGGVVEIRFPWADFDATHDDDSGLTHTSAPVNGESWFFNIGRISSDGTAENFLPIWNYNTTQSFANHPHGVITFVGGPVASEVVAPTIADSDGDGRSDASENLAGTDPFDAGDYFRVSGVVSAADGIGIVWDTVPGVRYEVEFSETLEDGGTWETIGTVEGSGETVEFQDIAPDRLQTREGYYRARAANP